MTPVSNVIRFHDQKEISLEDAMGICKKASGIKIEEAEQLGTDVFVILQLKFSEALIDFNKEGKLEIVKKP